MEENLTKLVSAMAAFKREMYEGINLYSELLNMVNEQNRLDINSFLVNVPGMTQDEIAKEAAILSGKAEGREYIFGMIEKMIEK